MAFACEGLKRDLVLRAKFSYFRVRGAAAGVRLHEKGGKEHAMPTHPNLDR